MSAGISGTLNGNLKYRSISLNGTKNPKYHSKYHLKNHSDTIQIPMAIIPPRTIQIPFKTPLKTQWYLNAFFCKGSANLYWKEACSSLCSDKSRQLSQWCIPCSRPPASNDHSSATFDFGHIRHVEGVGVFPAMLEFEIRLTSNYMHGHLHVYEWWTTILQ